MRKKKIYLSHITARNGQHATAFLKGNLLTTERLLFKKFGKENIKLVSAVFGLQAEHHIPPGTVFDYDTVDKAALLSLINMQANTFLTFKEVEITTLCLNGAGMAVVKAMPGFGYCGIQIVTFNAANGLDAPVHYSFKTDVPFWLEYSDEGEPRYTMKSNVKQRARNREASYLHWKSSENLLAATLLL